MTHPTIDQAAGEAVPQPNPRMAEIVRDAVAGSCAFTRTIGQPVTLHDGSIAFGVAYVVSADMIREWEGREGAREKSQ